MTPGGPGGRGLATATLTLANIGTMTWRNLLSYLRVPQAVFFASLQPVMFVLLFRFVFGGAIGQALPPGVSYPDYLLPGAITMALAFGATATAVGLAADLRSGLVERFRALPMARSAALAGRTCADLCRNVFVLAWMTGLGYLVGFRIHEGLLRYLAAGALALAFAFAFAWIFCLVGLSAGSPEAANIIAFPVLFPLGFVSSALVPVSSMPGWLAVVAAHQPVSYTADAVRALLIGGPAAGAVVGSLAWTAGILAVFAPLAIRRYRRVSLR
jgi:ABC-2 type transport system permease protein/oleandomycin transport system permease protein